MGRRGEAREHQGRIEPFAFIVVGAGTAGCVLATRLSESGAHRVLLVEAGGEARGPIFSAPGGIARLLSDPRHNWLYQTEPEPELGGRRVEQPAGRVIGGSGSINALLHVQGQPQDYDGWRDAGCPGWGWAEVRPWLARVRLPVSPMPERLLLADAFIAAAREAGFPENPDFNGERQEGAGYYRMNTERGRRASTARTYLEPARRRPNLTVLAHTLVRRVLLEGGRAAGIETDRGTFRASREVVLAAGAYNSPRLLELSGIGDGARLQQLGIPVVRHAPAVGEHLQNHFRAGVVVRANTPVTLNDELRSRWGKAKAVLRYALVRKGPLAATTYAGGFFRSRPDRERPDPQVTFWHYSAQRRDASGIVLHPFSGFSANVVLLRPQSEGSAHARSADPREAPEIRANFLAEPADRETIVAGLVLLRGIFRQPSLARYVAEELAPGAQDLLAHARANGGPVYHPVGTCRMGGSAACVLDPQLRVRGVEALRVADASVMPAIISGNTNAPVAMIGERAAGWMLAALPS